MLIFCINSITFSNNIPIIFGKVSIEEFKLYDNNFDTNASCVVLCDHGYFYSDEFRFVRTLRLKILKKEGCQWLEDQTFITPDQTDIRGKIITMHDNDLVIKKIRNSSIIKNSTQNKNFTARFSVPFAEIGSIVDLEFSYRGIPFEWQFQLDIPVQWSEIIIQDSPYITFRKTISGYEPLFIYGKDRWVAKNMPAFSNESFMGPETNVTTKIEFEIISINYLGFQKKWPTTWNSVLTCLEKNGHFGGALRGSFYLNTIAKKIRKTCTTEEEMVQAAVTEAKKIKWNKTESLFASTPFLNTVYKKKYGNSADINMILIQLLNKLGLKTFPLLLSTRKNGYVSHTFPDIRKLNYLLACTKIGSKNYYLDATQQLLPYNLIPVKCLNGSGRLLLKNKTQKIELKPSGKSREVTTCDIQVSNNSTVDGTIRYNKFDYAALNFRNNYNTFKTHDDYIKEFKRDKPGITITGSNIENINDCNLPVIEEFSITLDDQINLKNGKYHISPGLLEQSTKNPFLLKERKYTVDFIYPIEKKYIIRITVPENFTINRLPKPLTKTLPDSSAQFSYSVSRDNNRILFRYSYSINKTVFKPDEYGPLKDFFDVIVQKISEPAVLQKDPPAHTMKVKKDYIKF